MSFIIKNKTGKPIDLGGVSLPADRPYKVESLNDFMLAALQAKAISITDADETLEERRDDIEAFKPFHTGDPAIDGKK